jgi:DNA-binding PadR family transcriptional regulator
MGWSRPRAYQVFQALEGEGLVRSRPERTGAAGRPRKIYEVIAT